MSQNFPKVPVRFIAENADLLKSQAGQTLGGTDYAQTETVPVHPPGVTPSYRTPPDRASGNQLFKRYPNGELDYANAKNLVVDALHRAKDGGPLHNAEKVTLGIMFPQSFDYVDAGVIMQIAKVQLKLIPEEVMNIRAVVSAHIAEEMNYNAGKGGGSTPGRHQTRRT